MPSRTIHRLKQHDTFIYMHDDKRVTNSTELDRIAALAIPPAWDDVKIAKSPHSKIQASGRDSAGRIQYIYSAAFRAKQEAAKFDRILQFAQHLPKLRRMVKKDLARKRFDKRKVIACAVSLMDETYFRVGNEQYARDHQHYGITTLRSKHVHVEGNTVIFDFIGKSGKHQHKTVTDKTIATMIRKLDNMPGYELFRYYDKNNQLQNLTATDVNDYIKAEMGDEYSAKDFRTWGGTLLACMELAKIDRPRSKVERQKIVNVCIEKVANKLGNTPAIARSSYIDPRIITMFNTSNSLAKVYSTIQNMRQARHINSDEQCTLRVLKTS